MSDLPVRRKRACDVCHQRKIQCDATVPQCDWCRHHGLLCTFDRAVLTRKRPRYRQQTPSSERAECLDDASASVLPDQLDSPKSSSLQTISNIEKVPGGNVGNIVKNHPQRQSPARSGDVLFAGHCLNEISSPNSIPFFAAENQDWIRSRTGERDAFHFLWAIDSIRQSELSSSGFRPPNLTLPPRTATEEYLHLFRSTPLRLVFPVIDAVLFRETIDQAYSEGEGSATAKASVFSFLSIICHTPWNLKDSTLIDSEECAFAAQNLVPLAKLEPDLTGYQFCVMQCMYHLFCGRFQLASMCHGLACRIMFMLGAHILPSKAGVSDKARRTESHLRKLFWLCYTFDKIIPLRTGQPPCIDDEYCDLTLPPGYVDILYNIGDFDDGPSTTLCYLPSDLRLSMIKSKTCKLLYSAHARQKSDAECLRDVRELDEELESWRVSVPSKYRPELSLPVELKLDPSMDPTQKAHLVVLNFEYQHLVATMHRATGRFRGGSSGESEVGGVGSSQALSVQASRVCLAYFRMAAPSIPPPAFWMIVFYPISAIVTLFRNILLQPLDDEARADLELIKPVPDLVRSIQARQLITPELLHTKSVDDFVAEVVRLGNCAIAKAEREND